MQTTSHDIIIIGGGMVGLTLACALAKDTSLSIVILEAQYQAHPWSACDYHHRVSAIALSSQRIFKNLQIWDMITNKRISPFTQIQVWDASGHGEINFASREIAEPALGFIIENNAIQSALEEKIQQYPQIEYIAPVTLAGFRHSDDGVEIISTDHHTYKATLAIAADGANSWLRDQACITLDKYDYEQEAIVATVETELPHQKVARQVFLASGPLAHLPLEPANSSSIVWSLPTNEAKRLQSVDIEEFKTELAQAFSHRLGNVLAVHGRFTFPLRKQQAANYAKANIALVGDAAHTIHPLAGQGVNMGLLDAACLAEVITNAVHNGRDYARLHNLRRYERWRKADNLAMLAGVDMIKTLFASDKKSVQALRSFGLNMTNRVQIIKNIFTRHALGDRNCLPELAKERH